MFVFVACVLLCVSLPISHRFTQRSIGIHIFYAVYFIVHCTIMLEARLLIIPTVRTQYEQNYPNYKLSDFNYIHVLLLESCNIYTYSCDIFLFFYLLIFFIFYFIFFIFYFFIFYFMFFQTLQKRVIAHINIFQF